MAQTCFRYRFNCCSRGSSHDVSSLALHLCYAGLVDEVVRTPKIGKTTGEWKNIFFFFMRSMDEIQRYTNEDKSSTKILARLGEKRSVSKLRKPHLVIKNNLHFLLFSSRVEIILSRSKRPGQRKGKKKNQRLKRGEEGEESRVKSEGERERRMDFNILESQIRLASRSSSINTHKSPDESSQKFTPNVTK